ncbi:MAG: YjgP/YjgQ family permease [Ignavibacteria bacterium]|nr:YjgP/YjgQ family permease [Ignavibacteria bacterium]
MLLYRYILRSHIAPFVFGTSVIMALFLIQYMMRWVDKLASKGLDPATIAQFLVLNLSWIVVLAIPIGVLFSTIMAFGAMSSNHEVTVMKASGMGLLKMMIPVLSVGSILWGFTFWYTDNVLPDSNVRLTGMMRDIESTKPSFAVEEGQFTTYNATTSILARRVLPNGVMLGVSIYDKSKSDFVNVVSADSGRLAFSPSLTRLVIQLTSGEIHQRGIRNPDEYRVVSFDRYQIVLPADKFFYEASDVTGSSRGEREMTIDDMQKIVNNAQAQEQMAVQRYDSIFMQHIQDLKTYHKGLPADVSRDDGLQRASSFIMTAQSMMESENQRAKAEHIAANRYLVEIHKKYAIPFACLLFVFVGSPLGILTKGGNFGTSAMYSLGFYVLYWMCMIGGEEFADRGLLSPLVAMWLGNAIIGVIGIWITVRVNNR